MHVKSHCCFFILCLQMSGVTNLKSVPRQAGAAEGSSSQSGAAASETLDSIKERYAAAWFSLLKHSGLILLACPIVPSYKMLSYAVQYGICVARCFIHALLYHWDICWVFIDVVFAAPYYPVTKGSYSFRFSKFTYFPSIWFIRSMFENAIAP